MTTDTDVLVVGGGVAGLTASIFTARAGLETLVARKGESLLRRNAHLENVPGFPAGVNSRLFLDMVADQAERVGATLRDGEVTALEREGEGFVAELADGESAAADFVVAATKNETSFLEGLDVELDRRGSKTYLPTEKGGQTNVDGLYAAGRLAAKPHQTVVAAGHGAEVALAVIQNAGVPFYHDWVAPEGYFTGRGRDVPPAVEEIDEEERRRRERESMEVMRRYFDEPHPDRPTMHPSVADGDDD